MARRELGSQRVLAISSLNKVGWEGRRWQLSTSKESLLFLLITTSLPLVLCVWSSPVLVLTCPVSHPAWAVPGETGRNPRRHCFGTPQTLSEQGPLLPCLILTTILWDRDLSPHFTDGKTGSEKLSDLPRYTNNKAWICFPGLGRWFCAGLKAQCLWVWIPVCHLWANDKFLNQLVPQFPLL